MKRIISLYAIVGLTTGTISGLVMPGVAQAALPVFDSSNYAQNLLIAARTLQQINNQIRSLQNEATMLTNQARNLTRIDFPQIQQISQSLQSITALMHQANSIDFGISQVSQQVRMLFPGFSAPGLLTGQSLTNAQARYDAAMAAFRQTMGVQSQVVENVQSDGQMLADIVARSQNADGALAAQQASNQLLALAAKQQFQLQSMMAAQFRAEAVDRARQLQSSEDARAATEKFLGSGEAYTPQ